MQQAIARNAREEGRQAVRSMVVFVGADCPPSLVVRQDIIAVETSSSGLLEILYKNEIAVVVFGSKLGPEHIKATLLEIKAAFPANRAHNIILGAGNLPELFQDFVDEDRIFYLSRGMPDPRAVCDIVNSALKVSISRQMISGPLAHRAAAFERVVEFCDRLALQQDLPSAGALAIETLRDLIQTERVQFLVYDSDRDILTSVSPSSGDERSEAAVSGLVGYIVRTGQSLCLSHAGADPRYDAQVDDLAAAPDSHFVGAPIMGADGTPIGVLSASRSPAATAFSDDEAERLSIVAGCAGPDMCALRLRAQLRACLAERIHTTGSASDLFREEALDYHARSFDEAGQLLHSSPEWLKRTHWVTVALLVAGLAYMVFAKVKETATGPAVIRARNKIAVTATESGLVQAVEVNTGDRVRVGDPLVRFHDLPGVTALEPFGVQVRAPAEGLISDIRLRPGQQVSAGEQMVSIIHEDSGYELIALLPGSYAPQIRPGMELIIRLDGYPESHEVVTVEHVGSEIIGSHEAARYAGRESTDALNVAGPVIIVRSFLKPRRFEAGGRFLDYHDGMVGKAEVQLRSEPMLVSLIPGLKELLRH
jgi:hypothetical protein